MKFNIFNSKKEKVGLLEVNEEMKIKEGNDLFKNIISDLLKKGISYVYDSEKKGDKIIELQRTVKKFNLLNIGLVEKYLISKGYTMEEVKE